MAATTASAKTENPTPSQEIGRETGTHYDKLLRAINELNWRRLFATAIISASPLLLLAACGSSRIDVQAAQGSTTIVEEPEATPTQLIQSGKIAQPDRTATPEQLRAKTPTLTPEPTQTPEQSLEPGHVLIINDPKTGTRYLAIESRNEANVVVRDSWHNLVSIPMREITSEQITEIAPGLTIEQIDQAINTHINFDTSVPPDRQLQIKALVTQLVAKNYTIFPKDTQGNIDLDAAFATNLTIFAGAPNYKYAGGYSDNQIILSPRRESTEYSYLFLSILHEFFHWLADPGFQTSGLNESMAEAINDLSLGLSPEEATGANLSIRNPGCESSGTFTLYDYTRGANALITANSKELPGIINLLASSSIQNKINHGPPLSQETAEALVEKHYSEINHNARAGYEARKAFHKLTVLYCTGPVTKIEPNSRPSNVANLNKAEMKETARLAKNQIDNYQRGRFQRS